MLRRFYHNLRFALTVNWVKTLWFNFKKFPWHTAKKLPVYFYGPVKFKSIRGTITITAPIKRGMIGFGMRYEMNSKRLGTAEIALYGEVVFNGYTQIGKDVFLYVAPDAYMEFGDMTGIASRSQVFCTRKIRLGDYARIGDKCKLYDTDFHQMIDTQTGKKAVMTRPISLGRYNYIGSEVNIAKGTKTPDYCTVSAKSLCTKDYTSLGQNILIGGIPAKLLKKNISRDWSGEDAMMRELILHKN